MAQGVNRAVKFMLFFFNAIFFLCGLFIIIGCSLALASFSYYHDFVDDVGFATFVVFICVGVFIFLTGFFGCCGAMRENYCMLFTYACIILIIVLVEIGAGVAAYLLRDEVSKEITKNMEEELKKYPNATEANQDVFDHMQQGLKCCGVYNFTDWFGVYGVTKNSVPKSCCRNDKTCDNSDIPEDPKEASGLIYTDGCSDKLKAYLQNNVMVIIIICIVIGLIQITGIFCACCLMRSIKNDYEVV